MVWWWEDGKKFCVPLGPVQGAMVAALDKAEGNPLSTRELKVEVHEHHKRKDFNPKKALTRGRGKDVWRLIAHERGQYRLVLPES